MHETVRAGVLQGADLEEELDWGKSGRRGVKDIDTVKQFCQRGRGDWRGAVFLVVRTASSRAASQDDFSLVANGSEGPPIGRNK